MQLHNTSVLITGAGSGIGRATALALAEKGARLALSGRRTGPLEDTAKRVRDMGAQALVVAGDVTDAQWREQALQQVSEQFGGLDILINNAGVVSAGPLQDLDPQDLSTQLQVNLLAPILLIRQALPLLRASDQAAIVNLSSSIGLLAMPFYTSYAAAKGGIARFSEALRRELSDAGIHVMIVYPSATDTPMMETADPGEKREGDDYETPEKVADALIAGLESDAIEVIRGSEDFRALVKTNQTDPAKADQKVKQMKAGLKERAQGHRSM